MKDTIMVVSTIAGGPSEKLGIMAGDRIEVDGEVVAGVGIRNKGVMERLKGPKGTHVEVGIRRGKSKDLLVFDIERDKIPIYSVDAHYMVDDRIGYIKVNRFSKETMSELSAALDALKADGMKDLILDLKATEAACSTPPLPGRGSPKPPHCLHRRSGFPREDRVAETQGRFEKVDPWCSSTNPAPAPVKSSAAPSKTGTADSPSVMHLWKGAGPTPRSPPRRRFDSLSNSISPLLVLKKPYDMGSTPIAGRSKGFEKESDVLGSLDLLTACLQNTSSWTHGLRRRRHSP